MTVRIDSGSQLRFVAGNILELERGAVYVDTELLLGPVSAIEIRTPFGVTRNTGTQFMVRIRESDKKTIIVRVRAGTVLTTQKGQIFTTSAGEQSVIDSDGVIERGPSSNFGGAWQWVLEAAPEYRIEGRTLQDFLAWVARETGWQIALEASDEQLFDASEIILHGKIGGLTPDQAAYAVLADAGLEGELNDGTFVVRPQRLRNTKSRRRRFRPSASKLPNNSDRRDNTGPVFLQEAQIAGFRFDQYVKASDIVPVVDILDIKKNPQRTQRHFPTAACQHIESVIFRQAFADERNQVSFEPSVVRSDWAERPPHSRILSVLPAPPPKGSFHHPRLAAPRDADFGDRCPKKRR